MSDESPSYYVGKDGLRACEVVESFELSHNLATAVEYILRCGKKGTPNDAVADLSKAIWHVKRQQQLMLRDAPGAGAGPGVTRELESEYFKLRAHGCDADADEVAARIAAEKRKFGAVTDCDSCGRMCNPDTVYPTGDGLQLCMHCVSKRTGGG